MSSMAYQPDLTEFDKKFKAIEEKIKKLNSANVNTWKLPKQSELQIKREEYRNVYDYSRDFE